MITKRKIQDGRKPATGSAHLDGEEERLARQHASPRAIVIHEIIREDGEQELDRTTGALVFSALAGGLSMGFSFLGEALLQANLPDSIWRHAVASLGYSVGFVIVVLGRQQLFTESTLTAVLPLFTERDFKTLLLTLRLWGIVVAVNLIGTWLFAALLMIKGIFPSEVSVQLQALAQAGLHQPFLIMLIRGVLSGWLIALMVWTLPSAQSARLLTIVLITYVVGLAELSHIVAGSTEVAYAVLSGYATFQDYFIGFVAPVLIGNTIGGVTLVSLLNHGSIAPEIHQK
ncbi:MAG TPA: formate/nitrite transporter family protein [Candidatus Methylacidiphilales bacterium]